jgi:signal transduction histidine kinase
MKWTNLYRRGQNQSWCMMRKPKSKNIRQGITHFLVAYRWWVMIALAILAILNEVYDHVFLSYPNFQVSDFIRGVIFYGLGLPIIGGTLLGLLEKAETGRITAIATMNQEEITSFQIAQSSNWKELVNNIVEFPTHFLPVFVSILYVVNRTFDRMEYAGGWSVDGRATTGFPPELPLAQCAACQIRKDNPNQLASCACELSKLAGPFPSCFCMPLTHATQLVGFIFVSFPANMTLPLQQVKVFSRMAPEISLALDRAIMHRSMINQAATNEAERRRIAQDLHDSLAQNIGYLRLKLDQLTGEDAIDEISEIRSDLNHMKEIADQSYEQVRETLTHLSPKGAADLEASLHNFARTIGERSGITIQFETSGRPLPISLAFFRQISFICQEALVNTEKHAKAKEIDMLLNWSEDSLTVKIQDNGIGFDLLQAQTPGHYGISIMKERAEEINAQIDLRSAPGNGTQVIVSVPLLRKTDQQPDPRMTGDLEKAPIKQPPTPK